MIKTKIDLFQPRGTFTTEDGRTLLRWLVTLEDGTDGLVFSMTKTPWWHSWPRPMYYETTKIVDGVAHLKLYRQNKPVERPGAKPPHGERWRWALSTAVHIVGPYPMNGSAVTEYYNHLEIAARQIELTLERLEQTTT